MAKNGIGPLLSPGSGLEVRVIVLLQDIDGELQQIPVLSFLQDTVIGTIAADGPGAGDGDGVGILTAQDRMRLPRSARNDIITVAAAIAGKRVLSEGLLAAEYEHVGNEGKKPPDGGISPGAGINGEVGVEIIDDGGLGLGRGVGELDAGSGQELVENLPDAPGIDSILVPPHLVAGSPAVHKAPSVQAIEGKGAEIASASASQ